MHVPGDSVLAKTVGEKGEEGRDVEDQDDTKVGATGTQSLAPGILRWKTKDSTLIPSAQRLVWAAKQPLGNAALGALFA